LAQQGWPGAPHAAHCWFWQVVSGAVQPTSGPQHAPPALPHAPPWQPPPVHMPWLIGHALPALVQMLVASSQQPPFAQPVSGQHAWPPPPHGSHDPFVHASPAPVHVRPVQHAWPAAPHTTGHAVPPHVVPPGHIAPEPTHLSVCVSQQPPPPHVEPAQHACPVPPHATHVSLSQPSPAPHERPGQHTWPAPPHCAHVPLLQPRPAPH
jgi:hypothetical protein